MEADHAASEAGAPALLGKVVSARDFLARARGASVRRAGASSIIVIRAALPLSSGDAAQGSGASANHADEDDEAPLPLPPAEPDTPVRAPPPPPAAPPAVARAEPVEAVRARALALRLFCAVRAACAWPPLPGRRAPARRLR